MKRKILVLLFSATLICGCGNQSNVASSIAEIYTNEQKQSQSTMTFNTTDDSVTISKGGEVKKIEAFPYFYKEDYDNPFGDSTLYENGNLVVCLSMIESYYKEEEITPDAFLINHAGLCKDGSASLNSGQITYFIEDLELGCIEDEFKLKEASDSLKTLHGCILVYIPHNSIYGKGGSYLLITGIDGENFIVHDASKSSEEKNALGKTDEDVIYDATELTAIASKSSRMWIVY